MILDILRSRPVTEATYCVVDLERGVAQCNLDLQSAERVAKQASKVCVVEFDVRKGVATPVCTDESRGLELGRLFRRRA